MNNGDFFDEIPIKTSIESYFDFDSRRHYFIMKIERKDSLDRDQIKDIKIQMIRSIHCSVSLIMKKIGYDWRLRHSSQAVDFLFYGVKKKSLEIITPLKISSKEEVFFRSSILEKDSIFPRYKTIDVCYYSELGFNPIFESFGVL